MSLTTVVENRLTTLEREVENLKSQLKHPGAAWVTQVTGSMSDQAEFDQVMELGRAARQSDKPADHQNA